MVWEAGHLNPGVQSYVSIFPLTARGHMRSKYWAIECKFLIFPVLNFFFVSVSFQIWQQTQPNLRGHMRSKYWAIECKFLILEIFFFFFLIVEMENHISCFEFLFRKCLFPNMTRDTANLATFSSLIYQVIVSIHVGSKFFELELHAFSKSFVTHCHYLISFMKMIMVWIPHSHCRKL